MATQRYISTSFWDDEWIRSLDPSEKFVYLYLMTNPLTNIAGVYKITVARICFDTGYNQETVKRVLERFESAKKAYLIDGYMIIPSWPRHQKWQQRSKIKSGIVSILENLTPEMLGNLKNIGYAYPIDTLSIPYAYDSNYSDSEFDLNSDSDSDRKPESSLPVDNSQASDPTDSSSVAAADVKNSVAEIPFQITLKKSQYTQVADQLNARMLPATFIRYLGEYIHGKHDIRNPGGLFWKIITSLDDNEELIDRFRDWTPPKEPVYQSWDCPTCGERFINMTTERAHCNSCGIFDWDNEQGWIKTEDEPVKQTVTDYPEDGEIF